ncbi:MAG: hypothetical protein HZA68_08135 [Rhodovulum sp.]|nr:hypothetical protein [Rhodovulum sp.]
MTHSRPDTPAGRLLRLPLVRLLAINLAIGLVIAVLAVAGLMALDAHRLRTLVLGDQSPVVAIGLLLFGFAVTLGSWVMGTAVMRLGERDDGAGGGAAAPAAPAVARRGEPMAVRARGPRR